MFEGFVQERWKIPLSNPCGLSPVLSVLHQKRSEHTKSGLPVYHMQAKKGDGCWKQGPYPESGFI